MRDYAKVTPQFWLGGTGKALRGDREAQLVALYLMTSPHATMIGVFHCPVMYIAHETGLSIEGASKGLQRVIEEGFCTFDHDRELVWVHEMARFQISDELKPKDNQVQSVRRAFLQIPECQIRRGFHARYKAAFHLPDIEESGADDQGAMKGLATPFEAPSKPGAGAGSGSGVLPLSVDSGCAQPAADHLPDCPHQEIIDLYHRILPTGRPVRIWTETRVAKLRARWREDKKRQSLAWWEKLFTYIAESDFLTGRAYTQGKRPFVIDLEWIVAPSHLVNIIEGKYHSQEEAA